MNKPKRNQLYDAVIKRMVNEGLAQKEDQFRQEHGNDTDEQLLEYLQLQAEELQHTPWPKEIVGYELITERFGGWLEAVDKAKLSMMRTPNTPTKFQLYLDEVEYQKKIYRVKRGEKKAKSIQRIKEGKEKRLQREQAQKQKIEKKQTDELPEESSSNTEIDAEGAES